MLNKINSNQLVWLYLGIRKAKFLDERAYIRDEIAIGFLQIYILFILFIIFFDKYCAVLCLVLFEALI